MDITGMELLQMLQENMSLKIPLMLGIPLTYSMVFAQFILKFQRLELGKKAEKFDCAVSLFSCVCCGNGSGISAFDHEAGKCFIVECKQGISE